MSYFENYFKFPSIYIDGDYELLKEERSKTFSTDTEFNPEYLICETEVSIDDHIVSVAEAWEPSENGVITALDTNTLNFTRVKFFDAGQYLIPWTKKEFKEKWEKYKGKKNTESKLIALKGKDEILDFFKQLNIKQDEQE